MSRLGTREAASWPAAPIGMTNDRLSVSRAPGVAFGVRLTPAGAALRSLASPALAVDRKVGPRPSQAMSVSAMHARARLAASPPSPVPPTTIPPRAERRASVAACHRAESYLSRTAKEKG